MDTSERVPEWEFLERIDRLELSLRDVTILAGTVFALGFYDLASRSPNPRKVKDDYVATMRQVNLGKGLLDVLEESMVDACERIEKLKK